jgi:archaellum component FlaC
LTIVSHEERSRVAQLQEQIQQKDGQYDKVVAEFEQFKTEAKMQIDSLTQNKSDAIEKVEEEMETAIRQAAELSDKLQQLNEQ